MCSMPRKATLLHTSRGFLKLQDTVKEVVGPFGVDNRTCTNSLLGGRCYRLNCVTQPPPPPQIHMGNPTLWHLRVWPFRKGYCGDRHTHREKTVWRETRRQSSPSQGTQRLPAHHRKLGEGQGSFLTALGRTFPQPLILARFLIRGTVDINEKVVFA